MRGGPFQRVVSWAMARWWWFFVALALLALVALAVHRLGVLVDWSLALLLFALAGLALAGGVKRLPLAAVAVVAAVVLAILGARALKPSPAAAGPKPGEVSSGHLVGVTARTITLELNGNTPWTDTGLSLAVGETVHVVASGTINNGSIYPQIADNSPAGQGLVTADGGCTAAVTPQHGFLVPGLPCWSLIARVGNGAPFAVGTQRTWTVTTPGTLWLGVNNNVFGHSSGAWTVTITISRPA